MGRDFNRERWDDEEELRQNQASYPHNNRIMSVQLNTPVNGKVKSVVGAGTYQELFTFEYTFEDGVIMKANHKTNTARFAAGDDVVYTVKYSNSHGNLGGIDKPQDQQGNSGGGNSNAPSKAPSKSAWVPKTLDDLKRDQLAKLPSFALSYAKEWHIAVGVPQDNIDADVHVMSTADKYLQWLTDRTKEIQE